MRSLTMIQRADAPMRPYENQGPTILGATLTVTILAVATTLIRLYVRIRMIRNIGWDVSCTERDGRFGKWLTVLRD